MWVGHAVRVVAAGKPHTEFAALAPASLAGVLCAPDSNLHMCLRIVLLSVLSSVPYRIPSFPFFQAPYDVKAEGCFDIAKHLHVVPHVE
jgi:hypothetical protein